jgi:hypothetical protein
LDDNWISSRPLEGRMGWERVSMRRPRLDLCRSILTGIGEVGRCLQFVRPW